MVLIEQITSSGKKRQCNARCYNGKHAKCKCICGGGNHGKGLEKAMQNTSEIAKELMENANFKIAKEVFGL